MFRRIIRIMFPGPDSAVDVRSQMKSLKLDIAQRDKRIVELERDVERLRSGQEQAVTEAIDVRRESLFSEAATPISQLLTQAHLMETENKSVASEDIMRLVRRLVRVFEDAGLERQGCVGDTLAYDPNHHEQLSDASSLSPGAKVIVRLVGFTFAGRVIRKAGVELAGV